MLSLSVIGLGLWAGTALPTGAIDAEIPPALSMPTSLVDEAELAPGESPDGLPGATGPTLPTPSPPSTQPLPAGPVIADPAAVGITRPSSDMRAIGLIMTVTVTPVATLATATWLQQRDPERP